MSIGTQVIWPFTLAVALVTGGATPRVGRAPLDQDHRGISIEVRNDNFHDATVYAVRPGLRQRIGLVGGLGKAKFSFQWPEGDLRLEIDLLANGRYYTQVMDVREGDDLQLTILPYLHTLPSGTVF
jgi:hypothetical protein